MRTFAKLRCRQENNIKMVLTETGSRYVDSKLFNYTVSTVAVLTSNV
jgi:hypothetical protein